MALTFRFYRSKRVGTGVRGDPFRSKLTAYITAQGGSDFEDWILDPVDAGLTRYALAICDSTVHATIDGDTDIQALSPELANQAAATSWLDSAITAPAAVLTAIEGDRIPVDDVTTNRQLMRRLAIYHRLGNLLLANRETDAIGLLRSSLSLTVADLTAAVRNRVQSWMTERGISTTGITGTTTLRDVVKRIVQSGVIGANQFGRLAGA